MRQKAKYERFLRKRMLTAPSKGPIHFRAPSRILWRTIRGCPSPPAAPSPASCRYPALHLSTDCCFNIVQSAYLTYVELLWLQQAETNRALRTSVKSLSGHHRTRRTPQGWPRKPDSSAPMVMAPLIAWIQLHGSAPWLAHVIRLDAPARMPCRAGIAGAWVASSLGFPCPFSAE